MVMDKRFLVLAVLLLLFSATAFAFSSNTIQSFALSWNPNTNQLNINAQCKAQSIATLELSNGSSRTIICSTWDLGETWLIGDQSDITQISGNLSIQQPCDVCSRVATIKINDPQNQNDLFFSQVIFGAIFVIVILIFGFIVSKLQR